MSGEHSSDLRHAFRAILWISVGLGAGVAIWPIATILMLKWFDYLMRYL